jgi:2-dehydropantoate 2-reductase
VRTGVIGSDEPEEQRMVLMGCGAVGGVIAGGLLRAGRTVAIVTHNERITQAINAGGLRVTTPEGYWTLQATAHTSLEELAGAFDVAYLAMKATEVEEAAPGVYEMTSRGELFVGELDGRRTPRVEQVKATLDATAPTTISSNIYGVLWSKLAINCTITTLGAVTGQYLGEMLQHASIRRLGLAIVSEAVDVARSHGIVLEPVGGTLDLHRLYLPPDRRSGAFGLDLLARHAIMLVVGLRFRRLKSSMLQSLERGRRSEIDFMNGYVVEEGRETGVPVPVNTALTAIVREIEAAIRPISSANLGDLLPIRVLDLTS